MSEHVIRPIARIRSDYHTKFGIPRQAGIVEGLEALIVFEPEYRNPEALRGIEGFSHLWLIWHFSEAAQGEWSPTVRPPRLGGNVRMGVFATRSPFRPNSLGLSCVRLLGIERGEEGLMLRVDGADLMDGTPIFDIKPYIPYADSKPEALSGFAPDPGQLLNVEIPHELQRRFPEKKLSALKTVLANDPRPRYQRDEARVYAMDFAGFEIKFSVKEETVQVLDIFPMETD